jgi:sigma-B regulation protein RsbU (phosphoserine phosphatase)
MLRTKDTLINISQKLNIKLRWKIFVILLVFSLTPLLAVTVGRQWGIKLLEKTIVRNENDNLTQIVGKELKHAAEYSAKVFLQTKDVMEFYLHVLAGETERILTESPPPPSRIYFAKDFDNPRTAPPDFLQPAHYSIRSDDETLLPNPVSFKHPVFLLAPGIAKKDYQSNVKTWKGVIENEWLSIPKTAKFERIVKKLKSGKSGFTDLTFLTFQRARLF